MTCDLSKLLRDVEVWLTAFDKFLLPENLDGSISDWLFLLNLVQKNCSRQIQVGTLHQKQAIIFVNHIPGDGELDTVREGLVVVGHGKETFLLPFEHRMDAISLGVNHF